MSLPSFKNIGVFANWYEGTKNNEQGPDSSNFIAFKPLDLVFTPGYLSLEYYVSNIDDKMLIKSEHSFSIPVNVFAKVLPGRRDKMTFDLL